MPQSAAFDVDAFLREVSNFGASGCADDSTGRGNDPGDAFHQRGFPSSVVSGEGNAFARLDGEREVIKEDARAELDAKCLDRNHERGEVAHPWLLVKPWNAF